MTSSGSALAACAAVVPMALMALVAWYASRRATKLEDAVKVHFLLRHRKSLRVEDYRLWSLAGMPVQCLHCGALNEDFLECAACGRKQPFMEKSEPE